MTSACRRLSLPPTPLPPLYMLKKKKTHVTGVDMIFPENHNGNVQPKYARSKVQTHISFHK